MELQKLKEIAVELMLQQGEIVNTVFVETATRLVIAPVPLTDPRLKHQQMAVAGLIAGAQLGKEAKTVRSIAFMTEAWMSRHLVADLDKATILSPSQDPKRIEVLLVASISFPSRETKVCLLEMKRHGKTLELLDTPENDKPDEIQADILEAFVKGFLEGAK